MLSKSFKVSARRKDLRFKGIPTKRLITTELIFMTLSLDESFRFCFATRDSRHGRPWYAKWRRHVCIMMEPSKAIKATHININFRRNETTCCLPTFICAQIRRSEFSRSPQLRLIDASTILNRRCLSSWSRATAIKMPFFSIPPPSWLVCLRRECSFSLSTSNCWRQCNQLNNSRDSIKINTLRSAQHVNFLLSDNMKLACWKTAPSHRRCRGCNYTCYYSPFSVQNYINQPLHSRVFNFASIKLMRKKTAVNANVDFPKSDEQKSNFLLITTRWMFI